MKKVIWFIGIVTLSLVVLLNFIFTAKMDSSEHIFINVNNFLYFIGILLLGLFIYFISYFINKKLYEKDSKTKKKVRISLVIISIIVFLIFNSLWCILIKTPVVGDQVHALNLAQTFFRGNLEEYLPNLTYAGIPLSEYMQAYHQQISLSFVFSLIFRIVRFDTLETLRIFNIISTLLMILAIYLINTQLSKKYKTNKVLLFVLFLTFLSIPMLSTFIYGDIPSIMLCLFSVYLMMKYTETKKAKFAIFSSILTMFAYMMRMNSLIFIIATTIYLLLNLFNEIKKKSLKEIILNVLIIIVYLLVSIIPSSIVKNYYLNKYNLDKSKEYPNISYFLMAMEEGPRYYGWYNESIGESALKDPINIKPQYMQRIKDRLSYFSKNIGYTINFYTMKITSMWAENTYSALFNNANDRYDLEKINNPLTFYQKALLIVTCLCSLIVLIQNRKNLSLEVIFLITIFLGGFAFHILWEAKSRYILPYIIVLIPVASICIKKFNISEKLKKLRK